MEVTLVLHLVGAILVMIAREMEKPPHRKEALKGGYYEIYHDGIDDTFCGGIGHWQKKGSAEWCA
jgi:hypothetical protein